MKKILFLLGIIFVFSTNVEAASIPSSTSKTDYSTCIAFADTFRTISRAEGSYYYKYCYRVGCSSGKYFTTNMVNGAGFRCQNGNYNPYRKVTSNGCAGYTSSCSVVGGTYCTKVEYVDCNKTSSGQPFGTTTTTTTTKKPSNSGTTTRVTQRTTTKAKTTGRVTTKRVTSTSYKTTTTTRTTTTTTTTKKSNNANIKSIMLNKAKLNYHNDKKEYTVQAEASSTSVDVVVELEDPKSKYIVSGNTDMIPEEPATIKIIVTAEDGTKNEVIINVKRYNLKENGCALANIYIEGYDINFSRNTYDYSLQLEQKVKSLEITATPVDEEGANVEIEGNENLKNKDEITIRITGADESLCLYKIAIKKSNKLWLIVLLIIIIVAILGVGIYFLQARLTKSKGKYKYE